MQIGIEVSGVDKVLANLAQLETNIQRDVRNGLIGAANKLRDDAIVNLQGSVGTGRWGAWGHSVAHQAISDKDSWVNTYPSWDMVNLECRSEHAMITEMGGFGGQGGVGSVTGYVERVPPAGPFPIGKSQGLEPIYRYGFAVQRGYAYTTRAMNSPTTINAMINEVGKVLKTTIASVRG
jgi:hypothetical protein